MSKVIKGTKITTVAHTDSEGKSMGSTVTTVQYNMGVSGSENSPVANMSKEAQSVIKSLQEQGFTLQGS